jgi:hypothetical protein
MGAGMRVGVGSELRWRRRGEEMDLVSLRVAGREGTVEEEEREERVSGREARASGTESTPRMASMRLKHEEQRP